jgi:hypothetical protein
MITAILLLVTLWQTDALSARNRATVHQFEVLSGHPHGWKGHVVDHRLPLCSGAPDSVENMQWMTLAKSYAKDGFERALCKEMIRQGYVLVKRPPVERTP